MEGLSFFRPKISYVFFQLRFSSGGVFIHKIHIRTR